jgi:hypothetical protein
MVVVYAGVPGTGEKTPVFTGSSRFKAAKVAEMKVKTIITRFGRDPVNLPADQDNYGSGQAKTRV